jgi:hypothetical protein
MRPVPEGLHKVQAGVILEENSLRLPITRRRSRRRQISRMHTLIPCNPAAVIACIRRRDSWKQ